MNKDFSIDHRQALQQAFDVPWPGPQGDPIVLQQGHLMLHINAQDGARITSLQAFGMEVLRHWHAERRAFQYGCFPMVPWAGRLGNATLVFDGNTHQLPANKPPHALHGMACYTAWEVVERSTSQVTLRMTLGHPWPWVGDVLQTIALDNDAVCLRLVIRSARERFPASAGWHPWFNKIVGGEALQIEFSPDWQEEPGDNELPTGRRIPPRPGPWDDAFGFRQGVDVMLRWPGRLQMHMTSPAHSLVVFDKQPDAACVNPLTQAPDGINREPDCVTPDAPLVLETRWQFATDPQ